MINGPPVPNLHVTATGDEPLLIQMFAERETVRRILAGYCHIDPRQIWVGSGTVTLTTEEKLYFNGYQLLFCVNPYHGYEPIEVFADQVLDSLIESLSWFRDIAVGLLIPWPRQPAYRSSFRKQKRSKT